VNVWHANSAAVDVIDDASGFALTVAGFYDDVQSIFSANTLSGAGTIEVYDLHDLSPRIAIYSTAFTMLAMGDADALPTECAICLSFQALPLSGVNQQRRRGRLFLGPLDQGVSSTAAGVVKVTDTALGTITVAANGVRTTGDTETWQWSVFSPTTAGIPPWSELDLSNATSDVDNGWADNAFDTQRRRGTAATSRQTFNI
jgi:hypothetical protein